MSEWLPLGNFHKNHSQSRVGYIREILPRQLGDRHHEPNLEKHRRCAVSLNQRYALTVRPVAAEALRRCRLVSAVVRSVL